MYAIRSYYDKIRLQALFLSIYAILSSGYSGSRGKNAPPAFNIPNIPIINSIDGYTSIPIICSTFTPLCNNNSAILSALEFNSAYVNSLELKLNAILFEVLLTCSSNSEVIVLVLS